MLKIFGGPDVSGIGFAFGVERLMMLLDDSKFQDSIKKVAVIPVSEEENDSAFQLLKLLHNSDIPAEFVHSGNLSKKMKVADRLKCDIVLILGEAECSDETVTVKFMYCEDESSKTKTVARNDIVSFMKNNL